MPIRLNLFTPLFVSLLCALACVGRPVLAQGEPPPELRRIVGATVALLSAEDAESIDAFVQAHANTAYQQSQSREEWIEHVTRLRRAVQPHQGGLDVEREPDGVRVRFGGDSGAQLRIRVGPDTEWKIAELRLLDAQSPTVRDRDRESAIKRHAKAIERLGQLTPEEALASLESGHFAAGLFQGAARNALLSELAGLRTSIAAAGMIEFEQRGDQHVLKFRGGKPADVQFTVASLEPFHVTGLAIDLDPAVAPREAAPALAWEALDARLREAEKNGFSGVVIAQRGGRTVLAQGYGFAQRELQRAPDADTVFDIGSMPIDFTRAAVLWLQQEGRLSLDDTLGKYFEDAPADKREIRLGQLMEGRSGLPNFHHRDGDSDKDLSFIDRETALRRIFEQPLLFAPGEAHSHSHSAYGLLAMVVEVVSGQTYGAFLREHLFQPAGMSRTGFYGEWLGLSDTDFAVGYGQAASTPNIPPLWGPVSWLVVGSGGMVSSASDMQRGYNYLNSGSWLRGDALREYQRLRVGMGGSDRGYFFLRVGGDNGDALFLASNAGKGPANDEILVRSLIAMVLPQRSEK